jgi:hypothetical protein
MSGITHRWGERVAAPSCRSTEFRIRSVSRRLIVVVVVIVVFIKVNARVAIAVTARNTIRDNDLLGFLVTLPGTLVTLSGIEIDSPVSTLAWLGDWARDLSETLVEGEIVAN